jgi:hypothetical protein
MHNRLPTEIKEAGSVGQFREAVDKWLKDLDYVNSSNCVYILQEWYCVLRLFVKSHFKLLKPMCFKASCKQDVYGLFN